MSQLLAEKHQDNIQNKKSLKEKTISVPEISEDIDHSNDDIITNDTIVEDNDEDLNIESDVVPAKRGRKVSITYCHPTYILMHLC